jgi:hypothetical protein
MSGQGQGASPFSLDGSTPSQFTMPGGGIPQYQGVSMQPATLGGVQGVQDAQDFTKMVQDSGLGGLLGGLGGAGGGDLKAPDSAQRPAAPAGARAGQMPAANYVPPQVMGAPAMPQQGTTNLAGTAAASPSAGIQNLMQLLQMGNKGFSLR